MLRFPFSKSTLLAPGVGMKWGLQPKTMTDALSISPFEYNEREDGSKRKKSFWKKKLRRHQALRGLVLFPVSRIAYRHSFPSVAPLRRRQKRLIQRNRGSIYVTATPCFVLRDRGGARARSVSPASSTSSLPASGPLWPDCPARAGWLA